MSDEKPVTRPAIDPPLDRQRYAVDLYRTRGEVDALFRPPMLASRSPARFTLAPIPRPNHFTKAPKEGEEESRYGE